MTAADQIAVIIDTFEGHTFVNDPTDPGGATKFGIDRLTLSNYLDPKGALCPVSRVEALTRDEAIAVGTEVIARRPGLDQVADDRLRFVVLDFAYHSGPGQAVRDLQRALGMATATGYFGAQTTTAVAACPDIDRLCERLTARRLAFLAADVVAHPSQVRYLEGWLDRVGRVLCWRAA